MPEYEMAQPQMQRIAGEGGTVDGPTVTIDNRTALPDNAVAEAVMAHWVESAALQFGSPSTFQIYSTNPQGSMLSRSPFRVPLNVIEEIKLARQVADTDDDVMATIGQCIATAFGEGMRNQHEDEETITLFNRICGPVAAGGLNMDRALKEMYREYLIAGQFTTLSLFTRTRYNFTSPEREERIQAQLSTPLVGVLPSEDIRITSNDIFGNGDIAYHVTDAKMRDWLEEYFAPTTTAARKNQMKSQEPVLAAVFTGSVQVPYNDADMFTAGKTLYTLNQRMVHRTTMPKGAAAYPRPPLTANFALLEAKRLLNIMDYALLQGGTNYIVVAKQGTDALPGKQPEIDNLVDQVRMASRTGVLVGDHRLTVEIITPKLDELLNPAKRKLVGRKIAMALLRLPEQETPDPGNAGAQQELEFTARTITSDRRDIRRHVEGNIYEEISTRNASQFPKGSPSIWFPKIVLSGVKDFFASVLQARDRGDIPRSWSIEALGFDWDAAVAERRREKARGEDDVMTPGFVPNSSQGGRPPGASSDNGRPGGSGPGIDPPQRQHALPPTVMPVGEAIRSHWDEGARRTVRYGELTLAMLENYPGADVGRVTQAEREAVASGEIVQRATSIVIPVNPGYDCVELRAFRLAEGLAVVVGQREEDSALVARALAFREPQFDLQSAQDVALQWGFVTSFRQPVSYAAAPEPPPSPLTDLVARVAENPAILEVVGRAVGEALQGLMPQITINMPSEGPKEVLRDEHGAIVGTRPIPPAP